MAQFWVGEESVQGLTLSSSSESSLACWDIVVDLDGQVSAKMGTCGTLFPAATHYNAGAEPPPRVGDWRKVTVRGWMPRENIGVSDVLSPTPTAEVPPLAGTSWSGSDTFNNSLTFEFLPEGVLRYTTQQSDFVSGTWKQDGNQVYMETNNKFAEFQGTIEGDTMSGSVQNTRDQKWQWHLTKIRL